VLLLDILTTPINPLKIKYTLQRRNKPQPPSQLIVRNFIPVVILIIGNSLHVDFDFTFEVVGELD